jgi:hypothetical protein
MKTTIITALVACLLAAGSASATMISLDGTTLASFTQISSSAPGTTALTDYDTGYASFSTTWAVTSATSGTATVGTTLSGVTWTNGDTLAIAVRNDNENQWYFSFYVSDGTNNTSTGPISLVPGQTADFSLLLAGLNLTGSLYVGIIVSSTDPWSLRPSGGKDRTAEYTLATVPVPPAVLLLGGGLLGLVGIQRRFAKK